MSLGIYIARVLCCCLDPPALKISLLRAWKVILIWLSVPSVEFHGYKTKRKNILWHNIRGIPEVMALSMQKVLSLFHAILTNMSIRVFN